VRGVTEIGSEGLCQWVEKLLEPYIAGEIHDDRLQVIENHLADCVKCREQAQILRSLADTLALHAASDSPYHLSTHTLLALLLEPETLDPHERSQARLHLQLCPSCARDFEDARNAAEAIGLIGHERLREAERKRSTLGRIEGLIRTAFGRKAVPIWAAGAVAAVVIAIGLYMGGLRESRMVASGVEPGLSEHELHKVTAQTDTTGASIEGTQDWRSLMRRADDLLDRGDTAQALALADSVWKIAFDAYAPSESLVCFPSRLDSVRRWVYMKTFAEAESLNLWLLDIHTRILGEENPVVLCLCDNVWRLYEWHWRHRDATPYRERSYRIAKKLYGPESPEFARYLAGLANHYKQLGYYAQAESLYVAAIDLFRKLYGNHITDSYEAARAVSNVCSELGHLYMKMGRYAEAERLYREALRIREPVCADSHPEDIGAALSYLGRVCWALGDYEGAESYFRRGLELRRKGLGNSHPDVASSEGQLAAVYTLQGKYAEAESLYRHVLEIREATIAKETPGGAHPGIAMAFHNLAWVATMQGDYARAEPLYRKAIEVWRRAFGFEHPRSISTLCDLAYNQLKLGEMASAESIYVHALDVAENTLGSEHPEVADVLEQLTAVMRLEGRYDEAVELASRAVTIRHRNFTQNALALSEEEALIFSRQLAQSVSGFVSCIRDAGLVDVYLPVLANVIVRTKGCVSDEIFERQMTLFDLTDTTVARLGQELKGAKFDLASLCSSLPGEDIDGYRTRVDSLEKLIERLESELALHSSTYRNRLHRKDLSFGELSGLLPDGAALVEYLRWNYLDPGSEISTPQYLALILRHESNPEIVFLGSAEEVDSTVAAYRRHMSMVAASGSPPQADDAIAYCNIARGIHGRIWKPFENLVEGSDLVIIAPDGDLNSISFAGLIDDEGHYLVESFAIHYVSAGRDLARFGEPAEVGRGLLVLADPDLGGVAGRQSTQAPIELAYNLTRGTRVASTSHLEEYLSKIDLSPLPWAREEARAVVAFWHELSDEPVNVYTAQEASEGVFKREAGGKRVIHLATHGFFMDQPSGYCSSPMMGQRLPGINPLLRSGLLLAGDGSKGGGSSEEDGILTAYEVSSMNLKGTDLVLLSGCETGLGGIVAGEGVYGLRRAFELAGVRRIVSSLWPISDIAAAEIMPTFYQSREDLPQRLRKIELEIIRSLRESGKSDHPYTWAGLIVSGSLN